MILKKPYAFLIKHFKMIHVIISFLLCLIAYKFLDIVNFYRDYVANNYKTSVVLNLSKTYTPSYLYICVFLVVLLSTSVFILLKHKNKPNKFYIFMDIYYAILLGLLFYLSSVFSSFEESLLEALVSRRIRDIVIIYYLPQIAFIVVSFLRAIGFNVKKFNFKSDLRQMDFSYEDAEEFEFNVNFDSSKLQRKLHRYFREFVYYIKENRFFVICLVSVLITLVLYLIFNSSHTNYDKNYNMNVEFYYGKLQLNIKDSMVTNLDYNGNIISDDSYYVVLDLNIKNNSGNSIAIDYNNIKLKIADNIYTPENEYVNKFIDFINANLPKSISSGTDDSFGIVYKIPKSEISKSQVIVINNGTVYEKGDYITKNIYIKLKTSKYDSIDLKGTYNLNEEVSLKDSVLKNSVFKIDTYEITSKYRYKYSKCIKDNCVDYDDLITIPVSSGRINNTLLILNSSLYVDNSINYYENYNTLSSFANFFITVSYVIDDDLVVEKPINVTPQNMTNVIALEVSSKINNAKSIQIIILIRDKKYIINLKS